MVKCVLATPTHSLGGQLPVMPAGAGEATAREILGWPICNEAGCALPGKGN